LNAHFLVLALLAACVTVSASVCFVDVNSTNATPPYSNWSTAANDIQSAIDISSAGDEVVVADGVYGAGGRAVSGLMTNRVVVSKALFVHSLNGRCVRSFSAARRPARMATALSAARI